MTLLAAFQILLRRYSGQEDIPIGTVIANRTRVEVEALIGFFINTLVLCGDLSGDPTFPELLERVRAVTLGAYSHQELPFEKLVEELQPERDLSRNPLFQVMFVLQNAPDANLALSGLMLDSIEVDPGVALFDLTLELMETPTGLRGWFEYNCDLFDETTMQRMAQHFETLLQAIVANPDRSVSTFPILHDDERRQLLVEWNDSQIDFATERQCFHQLFETQVAQTPGAVAVLFQDQQLTYHQLNEQANGIAHLLVQQGVGPEVLVTLYADRSPDFLIAMLAVFKAGGAYLPLDTRAPVSRLAQVLSQSETPLVLTTDALAPILNEALEEVSTADAPAVLHLETLKNQAHATGNLLPRSTPTNLAYVIYTSGSTGLPKGAMVEQRGMVNHLYAKIQDLALTAEDLIAQNASQSFDISVWQFLAGLLSKLCHR
ncbi:AMP-binding protein [Chloroflexi bacterium TSY]|nr:AMP-binding protein [Chloroflexi bacterium TSY]